MPGGAHIIYICALASAYYGLDKLPQRLKETAGTRQNNIIHQERGTMTEIFVWWEDPTAGRVEWRYICMENGELLLIAVLVYKMLKLFADNWDMILDVRICMSIVLLLIQITIDCHFYHRCEC